MQYKHNQPVTRTAFERGRFLLPKYHLSVPKFFLSYFIFFRKSRTMSTRLYYHSHQRQHWTIIFGFLIPLLVGGIGYTAAAAADQEPTQVSFTADEQAEIDRFCEEHGSDVKTVDKVDNTLLHLAMEKEVNLAVVKYLVSQGADVNVKNKWGKTPLYEAALNGNIEIVKFLVAEGADVNAKDSNGITSLQMAARTNVDVVKFLVSEGADIHIQNEAGWTPLHWAVDDGDIEIVKFLVSEGADVHAKISKADCSFGHCLLEVGYTPLDIAEFNKNTEIIEFLSGKKIVDLPFYSSQLRAKFLTTSSGERVVTQLYPHSPLGKAGIEVGDIITHLDEIPVNSNWELDNHYSWTLVHGIDWRTGNTFTRKIYIP